jgi:hypothetical protein
VTSQTHIPAPLTPLTGLRGIAAYSVVLAHAIAYSFQCNKGGVLVNMLNPIAGSIITNLAFFGMSVFFVLSGFVIHYNYSELINSKGTISGGYQFLVARFARLYPLYALAVFFSLSQLTYSIFQDKPGASVAYLTMTQSWFNLEGTIFPPSWSVSTEWFFYLFFLFFVTSLDRIRHPRLTLTSFLTLTPLLLTAVFQFKDQILSMSLSTENEPSRWYWFVYYSPYIRIFEFISGILASKVYLSTQNQPSKLSMSVNLCIMLCLTWCIIMITFWNQIISFIYSSILPTNIHGVGYLLSNFIFAPALAPLLVLCCRYKTKLSGILSSRPLILMGEISYSVYILQFWVMDNLTNASFNSVIKILLIIGGTTIAAFASYYLFETPCRQWIKLILGSRNIATSTSFN